MSAQLAPLEESLMSAAQRDAAEEIAQADGRAAAIARDGEARASGVIERATAEGTREARRAEEHRLVDARRQARAIVLGAQRAAYDQLLAVSATAAVSLRDQPEYADLERRLAEAAHAALGPAAEVVRDPDQHGGVRARDGHRSLDLTLATLSRHCVEGFGDRVTALWT